MARACGGGGAAALELCSSSVASPNFVSPYLLYIIHILSARLVFGPSGKFFWGFFFIGVCDEFPVLFFEAIRVVNRYSALASECFCMSHPTLPVPLQSLFSFGLLSFFRGVVVSNTPTLGLMVRLVSCTGERERKRRFSSPLLSLAFNIGTATHPLLP